MNELQEGPPDEGYCTPPAGVHNLLQDPEYPPPLHRERVTAHQHPLTRSSKSIFLGKPSPTLDLPVVSVASRDTRWRLATTSIPT